MQKKSTPQLKNKGVCYELSLGIYDTNRNCLRRSDR